MVGAGSELLGINGSCLQSGSPRPFSFSHLKRIHIALVYPCKLSQVSIILDGVIGTLVVLIGRPVGMVVGGLVGGLDWQSG